MCVCMCVCVRERERERECIFSLWDESVVVLPVQVYLVVVEDVETLELALFCSIVDRSRSKVVPLQPRGQRVVEQPFQYSHVPYRDR